MTDYEKFKDIMLNAPPEILEEARKCFYEKKELYDWYVWFLENKDEVVLFEDGQEKKAKMIFLESMSQEGYNQAVADIEKYVSEFKIRCG